MEPLLAVAGFVSVAALTPGPNNLIVMAAAARGGLAAAAPAIAGVVAGSIALLALVWSGAGAAFDAAPALRGALTLAGALYLVWLGVDLIRRGGGDGGPAMAALPAGTVPGMAAFQLLNPKSWVIVLTATAAAHGDMAGGLGGLVVLFASISGICLTLWALAGAAITERLTRPGASRRFDRAMGALLIASALLLLA